ncbi:hypothetical protein C5S31_06990 [ANME-1 cluster archaeon GoMg2]|nr:hypothetical protein [ANME-1 cluster archaeon GoMg2]
MEKSDERFEQILQELRAFREDTDRKFDGMDSDFKDLKDRVGIVVGGFQRRAGIFNRFRVSFDDLEKKLHRFL